MVESFEEIAEHSTEPTKKSAVAPYLTPLAVSGALVYLTLTVFLPFILAPDTVTGALPLFFSLLFLIVTLFYLVGWGVWILLYRRATGRLGWRQAWPLLALPLSLALFYIFSFAAGYLH